MTFGVVGFCAACVRRAFAGWFGKVSGWAGTLSLLIGVALLFPDVPPVVERIASQAEPAFFLIVLALTLLVRLALSPWLLFREERNRREALERAARPTLAIRLPDPPVMTSVPLAGATSESLAGTRQTVITRWEMDAVALVCTNEGTTEAQGCRARLLSARCESDDGSTDLGVFKAVALPWDKQDPEGSHEVHIRPSENRYIWLGGVRSRGHLWLSATKRLYRSNISACSANRAHIAC